MTTRDLDRYFKSLLDIAGFSSADASLNGLQVDNDGGPVVKVAFAVDACLETFEKAVASKADLLFVHHGLFWGEPLVLTGSHRKRIEALLRGNLALYAVHLPLDQHPDWGHNAALCRLLGVENPEPFGLYHGKMLGWKGTLSEPLSIEAAVKRITFKDRPPLSVLPFGPRVNRTCAVVSGGGTSDAFEAIADGLDLFVTGESSHTIYHPALEAGLNVISGGHYSTEVWGLRSVMARVALDTGLEVEFIDTPTGL